MSAHEIWSLLSPKAARSAVAPKHGRLAHARPHHEAVFSRATALLFSLDFSTPLGYNILKLDCFK
jgi:hypothetical protein